MWRNKKYDFTTAQLLEENLKNIDGESNVEVRNRMHECLSEILKKKHKGKNIAIVSHGGAIKFLLMEWCKFDCGTNSFCFDDKIICSTIMESPSALKLTFENNDIIHIEKVFPMVR